MGWTKAISQHLQLTDSPSSPRPCPTIAYNPTCSSILRNKTTCHVCNSRNQNIPIGVNQIIFGILIQTLSGLRNAKESVSAFFSLQLVLRYTKAVNFRGINVNFYYEQRWYFYLIRDYIQVNIYIRYDLTGHETDKGRSQIHRKNFRRLIREFNFDNKSVSTLPRQETIISAKLYGINA